MLTMPTYTLNNQKIVKWTDIEVIIGYVKQEMQKSHTHGAKEFVQRFRNGWHDTKIEFEAETEIEKNKEKQTPKQEIPVLCNHPNVEAVLVRIDHMSTDSASGYFKDLCNECGAQIGDTHLVEFKAKR